MSGVLHFTKTRYVPRRRRPGEKNERKPGLRRDSVVQDIPVQNPAVFSRLDLNSSRFIQEKRIIPIPVRCSCTASDKH